MQQRVLKACRLRNDQDYQVKRYNKYTDAYYYIVGWNVGCFVGIKTLKNKTSTNMKKNQLGFIVAVQCTSLCKLVAGAQKL